MMKRMLLIACCALAECAGAIQIANLKIGQIDNGSTIQVSWHIDGAGWTAYYSVALTRAETPDAPATSRTIIEPYDLNFWQTSPDCLLTDTPPVSGKRYYYWLHVSADFSFQMAYLMGYYDNIKTAPCIGPLVGWAGTLADAPKAPTTLTASVDTENTGIAIAWNAGENAKTYNVYRADAEDLGQMVMIARDFASLSGVDRNPVPGRDYYYAVKSVNDGAESSDFSPIARGRRPLLAPTGVRATLVKSDTEAEILWTAEPCATAYDVYAGLTFDFAEAVKIAESLTGSCHTNVLSGDFAVKSHWYWVVSKNAYVDSKPSEAATVAVLPPTAVEVYPSGANIAAGSITLSWRFPDGRELPNGMTFSVVRKVNDGSSTVEELTSTEGTMSYTDTTWGAAGKTVTISYWVRPNAVGWPMSEECETRKRYGVFVGIDKFSNSANNLKNCVNDVMNIRDRFVTDGDCRVTKMTTDSEATKSGIMGEISSKANRLCPGDIFLFAVSSHGRSSGSICCHDLNESISGTELSTAFANCPTGVGVVIIIDVCFADKIAPVMTSSAYPKSLKTASFDSTSNIGQFFDSFNWFADSMPNIQHLGFPQAPNAPC